MAGKSPFADSSYLQTFDIRLLSARNIRTAATTREYVINELMAQQLCAGNPGDVLG